VKVILKRKHSRARKKQIQEKPEANTKKVRCPPQRDNREAKQSRKSQRVELPEQRVLDS
jgi:hypothetical protein